MPIELVPLASSSSETEDFSDSDEDLSRSMDSDAYAQRREEHNAEFQNIINDFKVFFRDRMLPTVAAYGDTSCLISVQLFFEEDPLAPHHQFISYNSCYSDPYV